VPELLVEGLV